MTFSGVDKALVQRAARILEIQANGIEKKTGGNWAGQRTAKAEHDRLRRDSRDLRALVKRLAEPRKVRLVVKQAPQPAVDAGNAAAGG